jgi:hypothetical protein
MPVAPKTPTGIFAMKLLLPALDLPDFGPQPVSKLAHFNQKDGMSIAFRLYTMVWRLG